MDLDLNFRIGREFWKIEIEGHIPYARMHGSQPMDLCLLISMALCGLSVQLLVVSNSLRPHDLQHTRFPCPSSTPRACSNSCPSCQWCLPTISSSVIPFYSHLQSFPASQFFASGGQNNEFSASAPVFPMNVQDWFPLGLTGLISLQSKGLSGVFSNTTVQKHQFSHVQSGLF